MRAGWPASSDCSLFDLPLGRGHSWRIREREIPTRTAGERIELISGVSLPAWRVEGKLDLQRSELFGSGPALDVMRKLIGPRPDDETVAGQAAVASFTRFGFEAAAITFFGVLTSAQAEPSETGVKRTATLRFDHPTSRSPYPGTRARSRETSSRSRASAAYRCSQPGSRRPRNPETTRRTSKDARWVGPPSRSSTLGAYRPTLWWETVSLICLTQSIMMACTEWRRRRLAWPAGSAGRRLPRERPRAPRRPHRRSYP